MDWDRVGADDLFLALSSFCPPGGRLIKVSIYPSEFGKSRMAEEDQYGPKELQGHSKKAQNFDDSDGDSEPENDEAKSKRDMERVRQYQVKRLDYYYAIAEFNSDVAAECVYNKCDKNEYEMSATAFDLRFIHMLRKHLYITKLKMTRFTFSNFSLGFYFPFLFGIYSFEFV